MCGRFTITLPADEVQEQLELGSMPENWRPRYNAAPTQPVAVVSNAQTRDVEWMRWGLIPSWAKDMEIGSRLINARSETVVEKPSFRQAFNRRRCILLADGFYEWQRLEGKKGPSTPYHFHRKDRAAFGLAGLWETWRTPEGEEIRSCTILTTSANGVVAPVHDRMPVMLSGDAIWSWINEAKSEEHLALLKPYPEDWMDRYQVSRLVNDPGKETPVLVSPATE
jgi:putative SOS response-associated peptidase YedK